MTALPDSAAEQKAQEIAQQASQADLPATEVEISGHTIIAFAPAGEKIEAAYPKPDSKSASEVIAFLARANEIRQELVAEAARVDSLFEPPAQEPVAPEEPAAAAEAGSDIIEDFSAPQSAAPANAPARVTPTAPAAPSAPVIATNSAASALVEDFSADASETLVFPKGALETDKTEPKIVAEALNAFLSGAPDKQIAVSDSNLVARDIIRERIEFYSKLGALANAGHEVAEDNPINPLKYYLDARGSEIAALLRKNETFLEVQEKWDELSTSDREKIIPDFIEAVKEAMGKAGIGMEVILDKTKEGFGAYTPPSAVEEEAIELNRKAIHGSFKNLLETVVHELGHSSQDMMLDKLKEAAKDGKIKFTGDEYQTRGSMLKVLAAVNLEHFYTPSSSTDTEQDIQYQAQPAEFEAETLAKNVYKNVKQFAKDEVDNLRSSSRRNGLLGVVATVALAAVSIFSLKKDGTSESKTGAESAHDKDVPVLVVKSGTEAKAAIDQAAQQSAAETVDQAYTLLKEAAGEDKKLDLKTEGPGFVAKLNREARKAGEHTAAEVKAKFEQTQAVRSK